MIGSIFGTIVRLVNSPVRAVETLVGVRDDESRILSAPGELLAQALEDVDRGDDE